MILETLRSSGFRWITSRVKKKLLFHLLPLVTSCLLDSFYSVSVWFLFLLGSMLPAHHACSPWVCRNAHLPGQSKTCSLQSFQCSVLVHVLAAGLVSISTLAASPQLSLGTVQALALLEMLGTSLCWCHQQILVASGGFTQCFSSFPGGNESSERSHSCDRKVKMGNSLWLI